MEHVPYPGGTICQYHELELTEHNDEWFFEGVVSALRHDSIVNAGDPDYVLVEGEAERVAQQAVRTGHSSISLRVHNRC